MEIQLNSDDITKRDITISHNGRKLTWNANPFERTELGVTDVFLYLNQYWSRLSPDQHDKMFALYEEIYKALDRFDDLEKLTIALQKLIADLLDNYHSEEQMNHWVNFYSNLIIPASISDAVEFTSGSPTTRDKTYLVSDYKNLIGLSITLRAILPIWGEFISRTKKECGTAFKEYHAKRLLNYSSIDKCEAMRKLKKYVELQLPTDRSIDSAIIGGIGSEDYPNWVLARVLIRRLCVGDISGMNQNLTIISYIHMYIRQKNSGQRAQRTSGDSNFSGTIREKFPESGSEEGDDNKASRLEGYKIQETLCRGDIVFLKNFMSDPLKVARLVEPNIDPVIVEESLKSINALMDEKIGTAQITLTQWVLKRAISPRSLAALSKGSVLEAIAVAQAVLWFRGYKEIAAFASAFNRVTDDHQIPMVESRSRITKELHEELGMLYPYQRKTRKPNPRASNPAVIAVDALANELCSKEWTITIPDRWMMELAQGLTSRRFVPSMNIKIQLATLVCQLAKYGRM